jgi:hypothetical protein
MDQMMCQKLNFNNRRQPHAMLEVGERQHPFLCGQNQKYPYD